MGVSSKGLVSSLFLPVFIDIIFGARALGQIASVPLPLNIIFDNQASSPDGTANFDGRGASFDSQFLPSGPWIFDNIQYNIPRAWGAGPDNVIVDGQMVGIEESYVHELHFLYAGDANGGEFVRNFILNFEDNSTFTVQLFAKNWWRWPELNKGAIQTPYLFEPNGVKNYNSTQIYQWSTAVPSESKLRSITFPTDKPSQRLHLFAMSYTPSKDPPTSSSENSNNADISIRRVRFTTKWELIENQRAQVVEITLANLFPTFSLSKSTSITSNHSISVTGNSLKTVGPGSVIRLVPGDQARVDVLVTGANASNVGKNATVEIRDKQGNVVGSFGGWEISPLIEEWTADADVLSKHEVPSWWKKSKYGIFIHWGVYSYPAFAPNGTYAEWYDWNLHNPPNTNSPVWEHHLQTFGPDVVYDDFIPNFTATKFNASAWLDLFDKAGAKYFVFVTKHHDGFALFDSRNTTHRSSVHLGPKHDFLQDLMETAKREKPNMHRGTYYSLPEWFNPDYAKYGFGSWPGGIAHNAFNNSEVEPYTGRLSISDYIDDLQVPQMLDIALKYDTEIMWCDIGGPNRTLEVSAQFYNHAQSQGRQVTINNRCGAVPDFDTPEYATFGAIQTRDWESSEGMDPFSYGLNKATDPSKYKNATTIIQTLVDIVSKNGNFLLDVGPDAEGEIIAPMANNLLDAGSWLQYSGQCVYDTDFWFQSSQDLVEGDSNAAPARFTTTPTSLCVIAFDEPASGQLVIQKRLPILPGDKVFLQHPDAAIGSTELEWSIGKAGGLIVNVTEDRTKDVRNAWAFRIVYAET